ncbi:recombinase family protein [Thiomonas sp. X19]|uniref:recombinase family protein n=1 Tax=Thiomonas sp. X19 TaxID=1050370 RepID=UPI001E4B90D5|nr:recombinase family protein [Thiomonas sp. X19]
MPDHLRAGDVVSVTRLDRLARSTRDLLEIAARVQRPGRACAVWRSPGRTPRRRPDGWCSPCLPE